MNKLGTVVVCLALLTAGLLYVKHSTKQAEKKSALLAHAATDDYTSWKEFTPRSGLFKASFPRPPQYAKDIVPMPEGDQKRRYDMYASDKIDGTAFLITIISYPADPKDSETAAVLKKTLDDLLKSKPDNHLAKSQETVFKTFPALDFRIDNDEMQVEGKVFIVGKFVYVLSYVAQKDQINEGEYQHFVGSFELLPSGGAINP